MATVHVVRGDLLESDCDVIVHQANAQGIMGAGIAKQIKQLYPSVFDADLAFEVPVGSTKRLGRTSHAYVDGPYGRLLVVNLYAQHYTGRAAGAEQQHRYKCLKHGLRSVLNRVQKLSGTKKIGLPYSIGCGLAGGDWSVVSKIIQDVADEFDHDIYLYRL